MALSKVGGNQIDTVSGDLTVDTNTLKVDSSNNRVGVNKTSPASVFHASGAYPQVEVDDNASRNYALGVTSSTFRIRDVTGTADRLTVTSGGSVGIGTTSPVMNGVGTLLHIHASTATNLSGVHLTNNESGSGAADGLIVAKWSDGTNYFYDYENKPIVFGTNNTEMVRILGDGKVGIGEPSPLGTAHIRTSDASITSVATNADDLIVENNGDCGMTIASSTTGTGNINFIDSGDANIGRIQYNHDTNQMDFRVNDSVRMCIRSGGEVNIGSASSSPSGANNQIRFTVRQNQGTDAVFIDRTSDIDSNYRDLVRFARNGTTVGQIKARNNAVQYNTTSDARLKENVEDMTGAIDRVKTLKPKRYSWIVDDLDAPNIDGFLAHEAQAVVPDAVSGTQNEVDEDGNPVYQGIDHGLLVPLLTGALKEAISKIETLETQRADLEARLTALEAG